VSTLIHNKKIKVMKLVSYCPSSYRKPATVGNFVESAMNEFFGDNPFFSGRRGVFSRPAVNIAENDQAYKIELAVPGLSKQDIEVKIDKDLLIVSARKSQTNEENEKYTRREFNYFEFERSFLLPETVDNTAITASTENGILVITLTKKEEAKPAPARVIEIA
jgi:HSP20 family protein